MAEFAEAISRPSFDAETIKWFSGRIRRDPSQSTVAGSLPVLFFGDLAHARIATVGLNPSRQEYLDTSGRELSGANRRFETLASLGASRREDLTDDQALRAIRTMENYFQPGRPVYSWFRHLDRVLQGFAAPYKTGLSVHLDLVQEATDPTWSPLGSVDREQAMALLAADVPFLKRQLESFPLKVILCNGRTAFDRVAALADARPARSGRAARLSWWIAPARVGGRSVAIAGWNLPLVRPTGLGIAGEVELGATLSLELASLGVWI